MTIPVKRISHAGHDTPEARFQKLVNRSLRSAFMDHIHIRDTNPEMKVISGVSIRGDMNKGQPDIVGHIFGLHVEFELKVSNNYPTEEQKIQIAKVNRTGGIACVLVHVRGQEDKYYMVLNVDGFSYRTRDGWIELRSFVERDFQYISFEPLHYILLTHAARLTASMSQPKE